MRKISLGIKYSDNKDGTENTGIIVAGYYIENISQKYYTNYFKFAKKIVYAISIITFIVSLVLCFINRKNKYNFLNHRFLNYIQIIHFLFYLYLFWFYIFQNIYYILYV